MPTDDSSDDGCDLLQVHPPKRLRGAASQFPVVCVSGAISDKVYPQTSFLNLRKDRVPCDLDIAEAKVSAKTGSQCLVRFALLLMSVLPAGVTEDMRSFMASFCWRVGAVCSGTDCHLQVLAALTTACGMSWRQRFACDNDPRA